MTAPLARRTRFERFLELFTMVRAGEGRSVAWFFFYAFLILVAYYILKTLREPLLLVDASAEMKSYAYATIAALLIVIIPVYGWVFRRTRRSQLTRLVTAFFVMNLGVLYLLGIAGFDVGFSYFVWVGIVGLMLPAQFWGYAADTYNVKSGQRLFPVIMAGATLGGLLGPLIAGALYERMGPWNLLLVAGLLLAATLPLVSICRSVVPGGSRAVAKPKKHEPHFMGGLALVVRDHYLLLLAVLILLLNWVNTTGEYILAEFVVNYANQRIELDPGLSKGELIATFYSRFYFYVNAFTLALQVLLVARIFSWVGIRGALLVLPVLAMIGYGMIAFVPVFSLIQVAKIMENSADYSIMNTARHALYLPLPDDHKYEGKTAIETFFWRLGDLVQAGVVFVGLRYLGFGIEDFALLNLALGAIWLMVAIRLGRLYRDEADLHVGERPSIIARELDEQSLPPGTVFEFSLPEDAFVDPVPGEVMKISAKHASGTPLPRWLSFDHETLTFRGKVPDEKHGTTEIRIKARDFDGENAYTPLILRHGPAKHA
ncbi:MAG: Npt1/Npt2 family nucleotide transporter [Woeseiaceae bacterium]|nr:Npt1/Npt2 family nucleotide transporter [Woeseiaceae bacterium]